MPKKTTTKSSNVSKIETIGKKIVAKSVSEVTKWSIKKKIIGALLVFMILCAVNCFFKGSTVMENAQSAIHEIEALMFYILAAINFYSAIILGIVFEKE